MPFPAAHPAAVLALRRYCPRVFSFPALLVGSLTPDFGYCLGDRDLAGFSHTVFPGSFLFCLPAGALVLMVCHWSWPHLVKVVPAWQARASASPPQPLESTKLSIAVSLLIGAWTHLFLDSLTHKDGWVAAYVPDIPIPFPSTKAHGIAVCDFFYALFTFVGVAWLALAYFKWIQTPGSSSRRAWCAKWLWSFLLALSILFVAIASRGLHHSLSIGIAATATILLLAGFVIVTGSTQAGKFEGDLET
jgi:hypothetical protein